MANPPAIPGALNILYLSNAVVAGLIAQARTIDKGLARSLCSCLYKKNGDVRIDPFKGACTLFV
jgi:hypothetical protein